ncbi:TetR/AcrR family transcriptional regulator [Gordonia neofelifaecis]|uniref:TetR family transcriptional regulator n=1 Tax=Gordonia neofelifaecis NRRL B-59395 TaxID=644548 RepID=F1YFK1_9ACTN|nr:TetR family transcriptional regulator [Gordonia neofelifaecis]EGD56385.1 TetR family transcriptional regulator [Gordonia neofelifaecis NRRL B-59395]
MNDNPTAAAPGTSPGPRPGLRERQKAQTRADIRAAALSLFNEQGYEATTVAQIAEAANVSHTTFFRYFQSKEQVIISDDLDDEREAILSEIPAGLNHFDLVRELVTRMYRLAENDEWAANPERYRILHSEPTLRATYQLESDRVISEGTDYFADYLGVARDDFRLRVFVSAVSGVMFHLTDIADAGLTSLDELLAALDLMEHGLPV